MLKNIVICCDGTGNQITGAPTNVLRMFQALVRDSSQIAYYDGGVGTLTDPTAFMFWQKWIRRNLDGAIGNSLRSNFCHAYQFLATHYQPGDRIYLFGFSRGAYTVRALAGAIYRHGILRPELTGLAEFAWSSYADEMQELSDHERFEAAARFKKDFAVEPHTPIWLVGVFDTVSSLGWIWDYRTLPNTANNPEIVHIRHAMAIDERRTCFGVNRFAAECAEPPHTCKEVWFSGVHSDVGGGYPDDEAGLAKLSLSWMIREASALGLCIDEVLRNAILGATGRYSRPDPRGKLHKSLAGMWHLLELCPRRCWSGESRSMAWRLPNFWRRRQYGDLPCIHQSVIDRAKNDLTYKPSVLESRATIES